MFLRKTGSKTAKGGKVRKRKPLNLALQGGGAHGAFAWGVIDRLLESDLFEIEGIVGTSAGAMNATVLAHGLAKGGSEGARSALMTFWRRIAEAAARGPLAAKWFDKLLSAGNLDLNPGYNMLDFLSRMYSPYQLNPGNTNPLRDVLDEIVDFDFLVRSTAVKLFVCASNVLTGKIKVFDHSEISVDAIMASACLPFLYQAVQIGDDYYWDGGYMGNPPIFPLIYNCDCRDILIVQLNPIKIPEVPRTARAIMDRINTLSFNSSLMREMRAINFVSKLIDNGFDDNGRLRRMFLHTIDAEEELAGFGVSSKLNADWDFLMHLHELGRTRGAEFIDRHFDAVGESSSTKIEDKFL